MSVDYQTDKSPSEVDLFSLCASVGWTEHTRDPALLKRAVDASLFVVAARAQDQLVGLARVVGDGLTIVYLQDILVSPTHQRQGIGRELFQRVFRPFAHVRQKVLMTDNDDAQIAFYEAMGFTELRDLPHPANVYVQMN